jgi:cbb3-type cytochrome oxidase cytochrome c subunit
VFVALLLSPQVVVKISALSNMTQGLFLILSADMKNQDVKDAVANGEIPKIVALIAYLNSLK